MDKYTAQTRIATLVAFNSQGHIEALKVLPDLRENTREALQKNREACQALGILDSYIDACSILNVPINYR